MPVPRRRGGKSSALAKIPSRVLQVLDINVIFNKTKTFLLLGFAPAVIWVGLRTEPRPSLIDLFNIWE